jgi:hypothetical protein
VIDEDSMGMELWGAISHDGGNTWTASQSLLPPSLLPNQTDVANFSYWCNEAIWQRAIGGLAILPVGDEVWGVGETTDVSTLSASSTMLSVPRTFSYHMEYINIAANSISVGVTLDLVHAVRDASHARSQHSTVHL